jgi:hypothetical protein
MGASTRSMSLGVCVPIPLFAFAKLRSLNVFTPLLPSLFVLARHSRFLLPPEPAVSLFESHRYKQVIRAINVLVNHPLSLFPGQNDV